MSPDLADPATGSQPPAGLPETVGPETAGATQPGAGLSEPVRDTSTTAGRARARWRRWRWPLLVAVCVLAVAVLGALLVPRTRTGDLDPRSATPDGARAVTRILERQGVQVTRVTRSQDVADQATASTTLVVVHPELLGPDQLFRIPAAGDLVLIEPDALVLAEKARFAAAAGTAPARDADPGCADPAATAAGRVRAGGHLYRVVNGGDVTTACYPQPGEPGVAGMIRSRMGGRTVTVLGQADVLRNGHLAEQGNAALALRLLGARARLIWYLPDPLELSDGQQPPTLSELTPPWVTWVTLQLLVALVLAVVWRARRLGRLVTEPLPIIVRAAETQEGRARLYRQAGARDRAAATLRTAAARRLAARLDVPPDATPETLADLAAQVTGQPAEQVRPVLLGSAPKDDAALVRLADALDALERRVSGARVPGRPNGAPGPDRTDPPGPAPGHDPRR
jgi:hypothetical protein